jgi:hypothetical protein
MVIQADHREQIHPVSSTSMDHLDELRVATASSLPPNGLAPRTYARDHATFEALSNQRGLIADWLVDRLSSSRTPVSLDCGLRRRCARRWFTQAGSVCVEGLPAGLRRSGDFADGVLGCPCDVRPGCPRARTYSG